LSREMMRASLVMPGGGHHGSFHSRTPPTGSRMLSRRRALPHARRSGFPHEYLLAASVCVPVQRTETCHGAFKRSRRVVIRRAACRPPVPMPCAIGNAAWRRTRAGPEPWQGPPHDLVMRRKARAEDEAHTNARELAGRRRYLQRVRSWPPPPYNSKCQRSSGAVNASPTVD
jgi:hypothetical protein